MLNDLIIYSMNKNMGFLTYQYQIAIAVIMGFAVGNFMMTMDITYFNVGNDNFLYYLHTAYQAYSANRNIQHFANVLSFSVSSLPKSVTLLKGFRFS